MLSVSFPASSARQLPLQVSDLLQQLGLLIQGEGVPWFYKALASWPSRICSESWDHLLEVGPVRCQ